MDVASGPGGWAGVAIEVLAREGTGDHAAIQVRRAGGACDIADSDASSSCRRSGVWARRGTDRDGGERAGLPCRACRDIGAEGARPHVPPRAGARRRHAVPVPRSRAADHVDGEYLAAARHAVHRRRWAHRACFPSCRATLAARDLLPASGAHGAGSPGRDGAPSRHRAWRPPLLAPSGSSAQRACPVQGKNTSVTSRKIGARIPTDQTM